MDSRTLKPETLPTHLNNLPAGMLVSIRGSADILITAPFVETDADVHPGGVFVARKGRSADGHAFIPNAIEKGAAGIVGESEISDLPVPYVRVKDAQQATGYLAASYYGFPSRKLTVIGVTGTDGKTTTTHLIHSILKIATEKQAGFISTIAADFGTATADTGLHVTTPGAPQVQMFLAKMVEAGLTHAVLEMTSHGLAQGRLNGVDIDVAVVTNITHEHLDYHGSWENYRDAKATLFRMLAGSQRKPGVPKISVINRDDPSYEYLAAIPADMVVSYGIQNTADFRAANMRYESEMTYFDVQARGSTWGLNAAFKSHLVGEFNIYNMLAAIAATCYLDDVHGDYYDIFQGIIQVKAVSGRMERIYEGQNFTAIVDFAHTPNALLKALEAGRQMLPAGKRLIAVFGSAGLRDVEKRRMMAGVSAGLADMTILTAEDPRTESLEGILEMMAQGCISQGGVEGKTFIRVTDRGEALYRACQMANEGDVVMVCGKGHEQSMCFGVIEYAWDDRDALRAALRGTPLKTLPTAAK